MFDMYDLIASTLTGFLVTATVFSLGLYIESKILEREKQKALIRLENRFLEIKTTDDFKIAREYEKIRYAKTTDEVKEITYKVKQLRMRK